MQTQTKPTVAALPQPKPSALGVMAARLSVEPNKLLETLKATVFRGATNEELLALVVVANEYRLNPFLKELYAFPAKGGGVVPIVSVDGWVKIVNRQDSFDGVDFEWEWGQDSKPVACTCIMGVKNRNKAVRVTEFYEECFRNTDPWKNMPRRMLRHKAFIQSARVAFGLSGIYDEDEAGDQAVAVPLPAIEVASAVAATPEPMPAPKPVAPNDPPVSSLQHDLAKLVTDAGYSFSNLQEWGEVTGNIEDASSLASFDELPNDIARRLLRNKAGLLEGLKQTKPE